MTKKLKKLIKRIGLGFVLTLISFFVYKFLFAPAGIVLFLISYLILGFDVLKQAGINIVHGQVFDENFLMTLATIGALVCGEYAEAVAVMLLYQIGEAFQSYAVNKSRKSIRALMDIRPDFARIKDENGEREISADKVCPGDILIVKPGEKIPVDGEIIKGNTSMDVSLITGESIPKDLLEGGYVVSGSVNLTGLIEIKALKALEESTVSKILSLVEETSEKKAKAEKFITVFAKVYTPIVTISAFLLIIIGTIVTKDFTTWVYRGMTFLLISCPCALVISIPLSFFGGIGGAGRQGILIKGGNYMDFLAKMDTLVLDKTGTVTKGEFRVGGLETTAYFDEKYGENSKEKLIELAAKAEYYSNHPIARSLKASYKKAIDEKEISEVEEIPGKGIKALIGGKDYFAGNASLMEEVLKKEDIKRLEDCLEKEMGGSQIFLSEENRLAGHIHIVDELKEGVKETINRAYLQGIKRIVMLTGDNEKTAGRVCEISGIKEYFSELSPLDKVNKLEEIISLSKGGRVAFVGDGINDALVLSRADIGIAMGGIGSDAAIEAADVVIMNDDLEKILTAKKIAGKTLRIVKGNIVFALTVKLAVLILAAFGRTPMWAAILADVGVAFLAIMNALRALGGYRENKKKGE